MSGALLAHLPGFLHQLFDSDEAAIATAGMVVERGGTLYRDAIDLCNRLKDHGTREVLEPILAESEEHVDWLEQQLHLIDAVGLQNYLTEQIGSAAEGEE